MDTKGDRGVHMPPSGLQCKRTRRPGTWQLQNPLHIATSGLQRRRPKEEGRVVGLITLHGPRDSTTLPSLRPGVPYLLVEHGPWVACWGSLSTGRLGGSPLRSVKTCKFSRRRGVQVGAFTGQLPWTAKKRPLFLRHGRILLGALALGRARPSTRPSRTCGTCCRPSIVHIRALTR